MRETRRSSTPCTDAELAAAAKEGDVFALGALLERHRPRLTATALRILGHSADAHDAVQEAFLLATVHLGTLREPTAAAAWLQAIVRRTCLQQRRLTLGERVLYKSTALTPEIADDRCDIAAHVERLEMRDWIWSALQRLPEPLQVSAVLRYFGSYDSYDEIAAILGVPIGTVRSRLSQAKVKLAEALTTPARGALEVHGAEAREHSARWREAFTDIFRRGSSTPFVRHLVPSVAVRWSDGATARGRDHIAAEIERDLSAGVRIDLERVLSNDGICVIEGRFINPAESPEHCPPGIALVLFQTKAHAERVQLHLSARAPCPRES